MKITNLKIDGYKNLNIQLVHNSDIIALIGNNGSGKSNLLEAISYIFRSLYNANNDVSFDYLIEYTNSTGQKIKIEKLRSKVTYVVDEITVISINEFLPKKVIAIYSGEEDRLWNKCFSPFYNNYVKNINKSNIEGTFQSASFMPQMLYLNKFYWNLSLLTLALSDLEDNKSFIKNILKINQIDKIYFDFNKSNYQEYSNSLVLEFIKLIDKKNEYTLKEFKQIISKAGYIPDDIYKFLYVAFSPKEMKIIKNIIIQFNQHLNVEDLSEGEKKLLLIKGAFEFAEQEDSLFILDEPDAHVHLNNKEQIIKTFAPYQNNRQIVITTHSPTITMAINDTNLFMVNDGKIISKEKQEIIEDLTGEFWNKHQQNSFLSSQKNIIILVEGKHDKTHILSAFNKLKNNYKNLNFDIFSLGGESKIQPFLLGLFEAKMTDDKKYIAIYDNDAPGLNSLGKYEKEINNCGYKKGLKVEPEKKEWQNEFYAFALPKPIGFSNDCTIENMYSPNKYEDAYRAAFEKSVGHFANNSVEKISSDIKKNSKNILAENSKTFVENDFIYFKPLFNLIQTIASNKNGSKTEKKAIISTPIEKPIDKHSIITSVIKEAKQKTDSTEFVSLMPSKSKYTEQHHLNNRTGVIAKLYNDFKTEILKLDNKIEVLPLKDYIAFKKNKKNLVDINIQTKQLKMWINLKKGVLNDPHNLTNDVAEKGHWGNGDYEVLIKDTSNLSQILDLIKQTLK